MFLEYVPFWNRATCKEDACDLQEDTAPVFRFHVAYFVAGRKPFEVRVGHISIHSSLG